MASNSPTKPLKTVLIHGAGHDARVWADLLAAAPPGRAAATWALDLPGHGDNADAPLTTAEALALWLLDTLTATGPAQIQLVGHSMGTLVALAAAACAAERREIQLTRIVLLGTAAPMAVPAPLLQLALESPVEAMHKINRASHAPAASSPERLATLLADNLAMMQSNEARHPERHLLAGDLALCNGYTAAQADAARLPCPCHIVTGDFDRMTPPAAAEAIAQACGATVTALPTGHAMHREAADRVAAICWP